MSRAPEETFGNDTLVGIVSGSGEGRRAFRRIVWVGSVLALLALLLALLKPVLWPTPLSVRAARIMALPNDAVVVRVEEGKVWEVSQVWFTVPEPAGPASRLPEIWALNGYASPSAPPTTTIRHRSPTAPFLAVPAGPVHVSRMGTKFSMPYGSLGEVSLEYDRKSRRYHFQSPQTR